MTGALYLLSAAVTALAWVLTRRRAEHRSVAVLLTVGLASDVMVRALRVLYLDAAIARHGVDTRWSGAERIAGHVTDALSLTWPAALVGAALAAFLRRSAWPAVAGYVMTVAGLIVLHPIAGDGTLARAITVAQLVAVMVALGCTVMWYQRSKQSATTAQACMMVVVCTELSSLAGSWRAGIFADWHFSQLAYLVMYLVLLAMQGGYLWLKPSSLDS